MILDWRREPVPQAADWPVAIVGGGPAGISLALDLEQRGVPSLMVEAGGTRIDAAGQQAFRAEAISPADHGPVDRFRHRVLGGTSSVWGGRCIPFDPIDFEERPWLGAARWPITFDEVARHYPAALAHCRAGAAHFSADAALPARRGGGAFDLVDDDLHVDRVERFSEPTDFGRHYRAHLHRSRLITVLINAPVTRIVASPDGRQVRGLIIAAPGGEGRFLPATTVVVACGALETARLLLASNVEKRCGLGNERDLVGRYYQSHLEGHIGALLVTPGAAARLDYDRDADGIYCRRYLSLSADAQRRERLAGLLMRPTHAKVADPRHGQPVLSAMFLVKGMLLPEYARGMTSTDQAEARRLGSGAGLHLRHIGNVVAGAPALTRFGMTWTRRRVLARRKLPSVFLPDPAGRYALEINAEQCPDPDSRVTLGTQRDALGQPRLVIDWRVNEADRMRVLRGVALADRALRRAGVARIDVPDAHAAAAALTRVGGHHIGTARMGATPREGVVDGNGQAFDVAGLHVLGAATFPTSGFANPTLTIVALAVRLAEHLAIRLRLR
jgi:choline dehydrogenase-like flavoprotein